MNNGELQVERAIVFMQEQKNNIGDALFKTYYQIAIEAMKKLLEKGKG